LKWKAENSDTTWYDYDLLGNLRSVQLPNGTYIQYLIDGQNRRVGKIVNGSIKKRWLYQNHLNIVAEFDSAGNLVSRFVYGTKDHVPDYMVKSGNTYRLITDHLGSVRLVVDIISGIVVQYLAYDDFGNVLTDTNPGFEPFGYAGGLYDIQTNLIRFGARDYDSRVGRWIAKDPINYIGGLNLYVYVLNSPNNLIDPSGYVNIMRILVGTGEVIAGVGIIVGATGFAAGTGVATVGLAYAVKLGLITATFGVIDIVAGATDNNNIKTPYSILLPNDWTKLDAIFKIVKDADEKNARDRLKKSKNEKPIDICPD